MGLLILFFASKGDAFLNKFFYVPETSQEVELNATIMEISLLDAYMIIAEERIELAKFMRGVDRSQTELKSISGKAIGVSSFKAGERVFVYGYRLDDDRIVATLVHKLPPRFTNKGIPLLPLK